MERYIIKVIYFVVFFFIVGSVKKAAAKKENGGKTPTGNTPVKNIPVRPAQASAMPHQHKKEGVYDTYNKKGNESGTMPHKHETGHYTSMADVSKLPPGYILLNGEPVRVADLEGK